jgi:hypothetical protein
MDMLAMGCCPADSTPAATTAGGHQHDAGGATPAPGAACAQKLAGAASALEAAKKAADGGDAKAASAEIGKALALVKELQAAMGSTAPQQTAANTRCPIMGSKIDPAKVPDSLTRV